MTAFSDLIGLTLTRITRSDGNDELILFASNGDRYRMYHPQDCCETVEIESIVGDLADLIGEKILLAEEATHDDPNASESGTWTFYKLATRKGYVDIRWYGSSNGYYSENVDFDAIPYKTSRQKEIMSEIANDCAAGSDKLKSLQAECAVLGHDSSGGTRQCVVCGAIE